VQAIFDDFFEVDGDAPAMSLNRLQRAKDSAARVVMDAHRTAVLTPNHNPGNYTCYQYAREFCSKWLPWPVRHTQPAHPHTSASTFINALQLTPHVRHHSHCLPLLIVPNPSTVFARRAFNYTAPTTWNSLPADILTCDSESGFKRLLKTHF